jgi:tRNA threonylcarbamoyladenosine biosynthesis protein TsaE
MKKTRTVVLAEIKPLAKKIAKELKGGEIIGLIGNLGAGKTAFAKALGKNLSITKTMPSPTFALMHSYAAKLPNAKVGQKNSVLYHLDFYRVKTFSEIKALGVEEFWGKKGTITVIEWADKFIKKLPKKTRYLKF